MAKSELVTLDRPSIHNVGPKPTAKLINWTPNPLALLWHAWTFCKEPSEVLPPSLGRPARDDAEIHRLTPEREELVEFFHKFIKDWTGIPEMVGFTFACYNIPRALLDQMVRHRLATFFVQSMRVHDVGEFAANGEYFTPDSIADAGFNSENVYDASMAASAEDYRALTALGVPVEDARGVLPMHINTRLIFHINLRAFLGVIAKRTCFILQQQYWAPLLASMRDELVAKVDPEFAHIFEPPCIFSGKCISKIEQEYRLAGKDPNPPCPKFIELYGDGKGVQLL